MPWTVRTGVTEVVAPQGEVSQIKRIELDVTGMTCAMCAMQIRNKLNKIDGVRASVDFDSKTATVDVSGETSAADLCEVVRKAGYGAEERSEVTIAADDSGSQTPHGPLMQFFMLVLRWLTSGR
jgi:cation-transporting P-type ATPase A/B